MSNRPGLADVRSLGRRLQAVLSAHVHRWRSAGDTDPTIPWSVNHLAYRRALADHFPTIVWEARDGDQCVAWITLGQRTTQWRVAIAPEIPDDIRDALAQQPRIVASGRQHPRGLWLTHHAEHLSTFFLDLPGDFLMGVLRPDVDTYVRTWTAARQRAYAALGYRDWEINIPRDPVPAPVWDLVAWGDSVPPRAVTYGDLVAVVERCRLLSCVPSSVVQVLERAMRLFLWGYQEWDFLTVAEHYAGLAADTSLRALWWAAQVYPARIEFRPGRRPTDPVVEAFTARTPEEVRLGYRPDNAPVRWVNGRPAPEGKSKLLEWALGRDWVSPAEARILREAFVVRDLMSHPDHTHREWFGRVVHLITGVSAAVNGMWGRWTAPERIPWEPDFPTKPRWATGQRPRSAGRGTDTLPENPFPKL